MAVLVPAFCATAYWVQAASPLGSSQAGPQAHTYGGRTNLSVLAAHDWQRTEPRMRGHRAPAAAAGSDLHGTVVPPSGALGSPQRASSAKGSEGVGGGTDESSAGTAPGASSESLRPRKRTAFERESDARSLHRSLRARCASALEGFTGTSTVRVALDIDGSGSVRHARATGSPPKLAQCIEETLPTLRVAPTGASEEFEFPLHWVMQP